MNRPPALVSIRVFQLARELGLNSQEVIQRLRRRGLEVRTASSMVEARDADALRRAATTRDAPVHDLNSQASALGMPSLILDKVVDMFTYQALRGLLQKWGCALPSERNCRSRRALLIHCLIPLSSGSRRGALRHLLASLRGDLFKLDRSVVGAYLNGQCHWCRKALPDALPLIDQHFSRCVPSAYPRRRPEGHRLVRDAARRRVQKEHVQGGLVSGVGKSAP